jgi:hypothetical protein
MSNRFGQAYGLTLLSPIRLTDSATGTSPAAALRVALREMDSYDRSPFARVPGTHLARWVVVDQPPYEGTPAAVDTFASPYLLMTSNFDGGSDRDDVALDRYIEAMRTAIPGTLRELYQHCVGFPGVDDAVAFRSYIRRCRIPTSFLFGAYPTATLPECLRALDTQRRMVDFLLTQQAARPSSADLQRAFRTFVAELATAPTPVSGAL